MSDYTQIRLSLGLSEEQAASLVNAAAFEQGASQAVDRMLKAQDCASVAEAVASRAPLVMPDIEQVLLNIDMPVVEEEGLADA